MVSTASVLMGQQQHPQKLADFKELALAPDEFSIPEIPEKRKATDLFFLWIFGILLAALSVLLVYFGVKADTQRLTSGYDNCGNVCGENNAFVPNVNCSGIDMRLKKFLAVKERMEIENPLLNTTFTEFIDVKKCVEVCSDVNYVTINCGTPGDLPNIDDEDYFFEAHVLLKRNAAVILCLIAISIALCLVILLLFRFSPALIIWGTIIISYTLLLFLTFWLAAAGNWYFVLFTVLVTIALIFMSKRIPLVVNLFREGAKAIFAMPLIILEPILTFIAIFLALLFLLLSMDAIEASGNLQEIEEGLYDYIVTELGVFTLVFTWIMFLWLFQFILGCQIMVISGAISSWYFARDQNYLPNPIRTSFLTLCKYHLGTVALGSLLITAVSILKAIIEGLSKSKRLKCLIECCLDFLQRLLVYITQNAYILTALHGESFFKSGRRAIQLIFHNLAEFSTVRFIATFILFMYKLIVVLVTLIAAYFLKGDSIDSYWIVYVAAFLMSILISHSMFELVQTAIDTILLCYCEDCDMNGGTDRPYYMSVELMHYFEERKQFNIRRVEETPETP